MNGPGPFSARAVPQPLDGFERSSGQPSAPFSWVSGPGFGAEAPAGSASSASATRREATGAGDRRAPSAVTAPTYVPRRMPAAPRSAPSWLQVTHHAHPDAQPRIGRGEEGVVLRLQTDRREPGLVDGGVGDAAVQPPPDPLAFGAERGRRDRVGPLDRVAALVEGAPGGQGPRLADRAEAALVEQLVANRLDPEGVDRGAVGGRLDRRAPARRSGFFGGLVDRQRLRSPLCQLAVLGVA